MTQKYSGNFRSFMYAGQKLLNYCKVKLEISVNTLRTSDVEEKDFRYVIFP